MIHYELKCARGHVFQAWFRDSATFERQAAQGEVSCAICGDTRVARALMAPNVVSGRKRGLERQEESVSSQDGAVAASDVALASAGDPSVLAARATAVAVLKEMRARIEQSCDYVGNRFAEEVRKIHYGETGARGVYGEADAREASALRDEGIEITRIPWLPLDN